MVLSLLVPEPETTNKLANSEKRKEKSRDAARSRRGKESEIFTDLAHALPLPSSVSSQLDKASLMRLTIAYLKAQSLLDNVLTTAKGSLDNHAADALLIKALVGFLLVLSQEGDIVYLSENVSQHLGLAQIDLIGQSIYEFSHPCDHDEIKEMLSLRTSSVNNSHQSNTTPSTTPESRAFFLRLKSTLTSKGRSVNLKSATYKVIHCTGRVLASKSALDTPAGHFLVLIGEPIPHPSNIEVPLDKQTFLTKHSLDMKYTYVDDKIFSFLGYRPEDLEGQSAYNYHHSVDNEAVLKSYKTLLTKGQAQTPSYRFLARDGGYAWVQTQSTLLYGPRGSKPQAVVCVHSVLSGVEAEDEIVSVNQMTARAAGAPAINGNLPAVSSKSTLQSENDVKPLRAVHSANKVNREPLAPLDVCRPRATTTNIFAPRTAEMSSSFMTFDEQEDMTVLKEEPEDLTHLAPTAGDVCIPLDFPTFFSMAELFNDLSLPATLDCLPLTGMEFPFENQQEDSPDDEESEKDSVYSSTASVFRNDPFIDKPGPSPGHGDSDLEILSPATSKNEDQLSESVSPYLESENSLRAPGVYVMQRQSSLPPMEELGEDDFISSPFTEVGSLETEDVSLYKEEAQANLSQSLSVKEENFFDKHNTSFAEEAMDDEDEFETRAPYIPMGDSDDLPLVNNPSFNWDVSLEDFTSKDQSFEEQAIEVQANMAVKGRRSLAQLLQQDVACTTSVQDVEAPPLVFNVTNWRPNRLEPLLSEVNCPALSTKLDATKSVGPIRRNQDMDYSFQGSIKRPFVDMNQDSRLLSKKQKMATAPFVQPNLAVMNNQLPASLGTLGQMLLSGGESLSTKLESNYPRSASERFSTHDNSANSKLALAPGAYRKRAAAHATASTFKSRVKPCMTGGGLVEEALMNSSTPNMVTPAPKLSMTGGNMEEVWRKMSSEPKASSSNAGTLRMASPVAPPPALHHQLQQQQSSSAPTSLVGRRMRAADSNSVLLNLLDVNKGREKPSSDRIPLAAASTMNVDRASFSLIKEEQSISPTFHTKNTPHQRPFPGLQLRHDVALPLSVSASPGEQDLLTMLEMSLLDMAETRPHLL